MKQAKPAAVTASLLLAALILSLGVVAAPAPAKAQGTLVAPGGQSRATAPGSLRSRHYRHRMHRHRMHRYRHGR